MDLESPACFQCVHFHGASPRRTECTSSGVIDLPGFHYCKHYVKNETKYPRYNSYDPDEHSPICRGATIQSQRGSTVQERLSNTVWWTVQRVYETHLVCIANDTRKKRHIIRPPFGKNAHDDLHREKEWFFIAGRLWLVTPDEDMKSVEWFDEKSKSASEISRERRQEEESSRYWASVRERVYGPKLVTLASMDEGVDLK
mgnify:CR=1 FL=1